MDEYKSDYEVKTNLVMPKMSKVIMLNDNYTTMEFVVSILQNIFRKNVSEARYIMLKIHNEGQGICGIYPYDIALSKANEARELSKQAGYPLRILVEYE
ncbi:MAG: ATP-dependent Clp protease adaptor ClpS [Helicobacteraceae bacterium]|nr:ATP-dependent Clp protease adaptor ClpS [Helicobacteraceae bacterium]